MPNMSEKETIVGGKENARKSFTHIIYL